MSESSQGPRPLGEESAASASADAAQQPRDAQRSARREEHPDSSELDRRQTEMGATRRASGPPLTESEGTEEREEAMGEADVEPTDPTAPTDPSR